MGSSLGEIDLANVSISPKYKVRDWIAAEERDDWDLMANIFEDRIVGRFLKPIALIASDRDIGEFSGFTIMAIDCLLIETLHQFQYGLKETGGEHWMAFWDFFKGSNFFKEFSREKSKIFYSHFRCGILHQAQTKRRSLIRIGCQRMIEVVSNNVSDGLIIDREKFHAALNCEFRSYIENLKRDDADTNSLRSNFKRKMNFGSSRNRVGKRRGIA